MALLAGLQRVLHVSNGRRYTMRIIKSGILSQNYVLTCSFVDRISILVPQGSLVAVVGHVGSGKSSLLSAMLGETEKRSGQVTVKVQN